MMILRILLMIIEGISMGILLLVVQIEVDTFVAGMILVWYVVFKANNYIADERLGGG